MADRSARANPLDARIPCPLCAQPIHPIAGRCKHCKTDLTKLRTPVRPVALPVSDSVPVPVPVPDPAPTNGHNGHHAMAPAFAALAASEPTRESFLSRRWPLLVAILAGIAIVVCAYILLFDKQDSHAKPRKAGAAMPAPDRMDTMPAPPAPTPSPTPPGSAGGGHLPDPWDSPGTAPDVPPQLPPDFDDPPPPSHVTPGSVPPAEEFFPTLTDKLTRCAGMGNVDFGSMFGGASVADEMRERVRAGQCTYDETKAARCIGALDALCPNGQLSLDDIAKLDTQKLSGFNECMEALQCH